jgi:putative sigma-54 modulation protein
MQINMTGHHVDLTPALRDYLDTKLQKLERHFDQIGTVQATLSVEKDRQKAEVSMHITGAQLFADAEHDDMYAAIDLMVDKLDRQLLKHKEKSVDRSQGAGR